MSVNSDRPSASMGTTDVHESMKVEEPNPTPSEPNAVPIQTTPLVVEPVEGYDEGDDEPKETTKSLYNDQFHEEEEEEEEEAGGDDELVESDQEFAKDLNKVDHNYHKAYEKYQEKFAAVFEESKRLFKLEQITRTYLSYLKRRNNGILEVLGKLEEDEHDTKESDDEDDEQIHIDKKRIENIISMAPKLKSKLSVLTSYDDSTILPGNLKKNISSDLYIEELIPDLANDDLRELETNPQIIENWTRRHYPNLVVSKLKPLIYKPYGVLDEFYNLNNIEGTIWKDFHGQAGENNNQETDLSIFSKRKRKATDDDGSNKRQK